MLHCLLLVYYFVSLPMNRYGTQIRIETLVVFTSMEAKVNKGYWKCSCIDVQALYETKKGKNVANLTNIDNTSEL